MVPVVLDGRREGEEATLRREGTGKGSVKGSMSVADTG